MHRQGSKVKNYAPKKDCQFAREVNGDPLPTAYEDGFMLCVQLIDALKRKEVRPQYLSLDQVKCPTFGGSVCSKICLNAVESLRGEDGSQLY
jgi:hypothetical protein